MYYIFKNLGLLYAIIETLSKEQSTIDSEGTRHKQPIDQNNFQAHPLIILLKTQVYSSIATVLIY